MATGNRTLKLSILADVDDLKKKLGEADKAVENNSNKIADFGKKAALAFAAAGAAAGAFAISAVKAAAQDETGRKKLEQTIRSSTKATEAQIAAIDDFITKQSIATATTDDVLRPAFSRLIRSTKDVTEAQDLLNLAQEISVATGKPLETVTNALGKAYDGSNTALGKLGIGIDKTALKTQSFDEITKDLKKTYQGFIENESENAEFKFEQLTIAIDETKESIGAALLPIVKDLADFILVSVVPRLEAFVAGLTGENSVTSGVTDATQGAFEFGEQLKSTIEFVISIKDELILLGQIIATVFVASKIAAFVTEIKVLTGAMVGLNTAATGAAIATGAATKIGLGIFGAGAVALAAVGNQEFTPTLPGGAVSGKGAPGQSISKSSLPSVPRPNAGYTTGQGVTNITVNAIDSEGAARAVTKALNESAARSNPYLSRAAVKP
jgi:hypothetical protein